MPLPGPNVCWAWTTDITSFFCKAAPQLGLGEHVCGEPPSRGDLALVERPILVGRLAESIDGDGGMTNQQPAEAAVSGYSAAGSSGSGIGGSSPSKM